MLEAVKIVSNADICCFDISDLSSISKCETFSEFFRKKI